MELMPFDAAACASHPVAHVANLTYMTDNDRIGERMFARILFANRESVEKAVDNLVLACGKVVAAEIFDIPLN